MLPDTGADVTLIGTRHLQKQTSLRILLGMTTLTADGSCMSPPLGWFQAKLKLGNNSGT